MSLHNDRVKEAIMLEVWEKNQLKLKTTTHTHMLWDLTVFITRTLKHNKIHLRELIKTNTENYIKLCKRKQITTKPEDCLWELRMGKICICTMLTILLLYSACLCYNCIYTQGVMRLKPKFTKPITIWLDTWNLVTISYVVVIYILS